MSTADHVSDTPANTMHNGSEKVPACPGNAIEFSDPRSFLPGDLLTFMSSRLPESLPAQIRNNWVGGLKREPGHFIVTEPVPWYPGMPEISAGGQKMPPRFLTVGAETDKPGLDRDVVLKVNWHGQNLPAVAMTAVKTGENTWRLQDALCRHLSDQLKRNISHHEVLTSGLKDRSAVTAQTVVVVGVSMKDIARVDWSGFQPGRRGFFFKDFQPYGSLEPTAKDRLSQGDHQANHFEIKVYLKGKSQAEIEEYMAPRVALLEQLGFRIPNGFHRQRLGPFQQSHLMGLTLLTGQYQPTTDCYGFSSSVEAMLHRFLFESSPRAHAGVRQLRARLAPKWQYDFEEMERVLGRDYHRYNLTLEYEVVKRLADYNRFDGCSEAVVFDLRDRLSMFVGAWQAWYWNHELAAQIASGRAQLDGRERRIPLPMSSDDSKNVYRHTELGQRCLSEMAQTEKLALSEPPAKEGEEPTPSGEAYLDAAVKQYWRQNRPSRHDHPVEMGLSLKLLRALFGNKLKVDGMKRPPMECLSAAVVRRLFLVPRDRRTGQARPNSPKRKAFVEVSDFDYRCEDEYATLTFALPSGSYATMLCGNLFETTDPFELEMQAGEES